MMQREESEGEARRGEQGPEKGFHSPQRPKPTPPTQILLPFSPVHSAWKKSKTNNHEPVLGTSPELQRRRCQKMGHKISQKLCHRKAPTMVFKGYSPTSLSDIGEAFDPKSVSGGAAEEFDPGSPLPFKLADIRAAIPKHYWVKDPWRSMSYVLRNVVFVFGLTATAVYFNNWVIWPLYSATQETMFWKFLLLLLVFYVWGFGF